METSTENWIAHDLDKSLKPRSSDVTTGENVTFADLMLHESTLLGLKRSGFKRPSPVQLEYIPIGRCGLDLVIQSKAGTGKTCVFAVVALETLEFQKLSPVQCIIIAPTREIAIQIHEVVSIIGSGYEHLNCALCIGGTEVKLDRQQLSMENSNQIIVGTPGRIKQLIDLSILKTTHVELLVLDEADKLMDDQFKQQVDEIYKRLPQDKQMIVTSATYPNELSVFIRQYMQTPQCLREIGHPSLEAIKEYWIECPAGHSNKKTVEKKLELLKAMLNVVKFDQCVIFTNYQARGPAICDFLNKDRQFREKNQEVSYICSELVQKERARIFKNFKQSKNKILASTDISARGIDIEGIDLVINLDIPVDNATYYHRIGRAGRFGTPGLAITIVAKEALDQGLYAKNMAQCNLQKLSLSDCASLVSLQLNSSL